jgi:hypothetical protein
MVVTLENCYKFAFDLQDLTIVIVNHSDNIVKHRIPCYDISLLKDHLPITFIRLKNKAEQQVS